MRAFQSTTRAGAFTLIELLAVVLILGLVATLVGPPLGIRTTRALQDAADGLAGACEYARQRAVMTGRPHRLVLDLDRGLHRIEWAPPAQPEPLAAPDPRGPIPLTPPAAATEDFVPIPEASGRDSGLGREALLLVVELPDGGTREGRVQIRFEPDGTADPAVLWIGDDDGRPRFALEVRTLADAVVVRRAEI